MPERSADWFRQAERDLAAARELRSGGFHEWSCFLAQQSAEKAVKAVFQKLGADAWGHSVLELLGQLPDTHRAAPAVLDAARLLDRFYIAARYPNGWAERDDDARQAIDRAQDVLRFCHDLLAR